MTNTLFSPTRIVLGLMALGVVSLSILFVLPYSVKADILFRELDQGMSGADVSTLQTFLATDRTIYPQGIVSGFYGPLTFSAVSNFQSRNGIATVGRVGPVTLSAINRISAGGSTRDVNAPVFRTANVSVTSSNANVTWMTNEATQGRLYFSTSWIAMTEGQPNTPNAIMVGGTEVTSENAGLVTSHVANVQNLQANTTYYYVIRAMDQSGNVSITWPTTFRTNQ